MSKYPGFSSRNTIYTIGPYQMSSVDDRAFEMNRRKIIRNNYKRARVRFEGEKSQVKAWK